MCSPIWWFSGLALSQEIHIIETATSLLRRYRKRAFTLDMNAQWTAFPTSSMYIRGLLCRRFYSPNIRGRKESEKTKGGEDGKVIESYSDFVIKFILQKLTPYCLRHPICRYWNFVIVILLLLNDTMELLQCVRAYTSLKTFISYCNVPALVDCSLADSCNEHWTSNVCRKQQLQKKWRK